MKRQSAKKSGGTGVLNDLLFRLAIVLIVIGCIVSIIMTQSTLAEKRAELTEITEKTEAVEAENVELSRILESDDMDAYMEKLAIESLNYAYPNERRFYDTSRN